MMALHQTTAPTDEIYFTLDSGACWYTVQLSEAINVQNIRCALVNRSRSRSDAATWRTQLLQFAQSTRAPLSSDKYS